MNIRCSNNNDNDEALFDRRVLYPCLTNFELDENNVFQIMQIDYFDNDVEQFYTICPNCGYLILLPDEILSEKIKAEARRKTLEVPFLFMINSLTSELINLKRKSKKETKLKVRARQL